MGIKMTGMIPRVTKKNLNKIGWKISALRPKTSRRAPRADPIFDKNGHKNLKFIGYWTHFCFISSNTPLYTIEQSLGYINLKILIWGLKNLIFWGFLRFSQNHGFSDPASFKWHLLVEFLMFLDGLFCNMLTRVMTKNDGSHIFELGPKFFLYARACKNAQKSAFLHARACKKNLRPNSKMWLPSFFAIAHNPCEQVAKEPIQKHQKL